MAPSSTIIITGATGNLGSTLAKTLASLYPGRFYLLLTCRNVENATAVSLQNALRSKDAAFSLEKLDLSNLGAVKKFTEEVKQKINSGAMPSLVGGGIVNSAAFMSFTKDSKTSAGLDDMYTINALAPALLARGLLEVMCGRDGGGGATVVSVGSQAHDLGRVDYFQQSKESGGKGAEGVGKGERLGFMEGMKRYGSSKLLLIMMSYAFQRHLYTADPKTKVKFIVEDPGSISGPGRLLGDDRHWVFRILYPTLTFLGPVLRLARKEAINPPDVAAKVIARLFGDEKMKDDEVWKTGKQFVLDEERKSSALSLNEGKQDEVWKMVMEDLNLPESLKL